MAQEDGYMVVCRMREEFKALVTAANTCGELELALEAQTLVIALDKFADEHGVLEQMGWPAVVGLDDDGDPGFEPPRP